MGVLNSSRKAMKGFMQEQSIHLELLHIFGMGKFSMCHLH